MKDLVWKLQPYLMGALVGWLAFWPPAFTGVVRMVALSGAHEEIRRLLSGR